MKKLFAILVLLLTGVTASAVTNSFLRQMKFIVQEGVVSEIHVSRSALKLLSPQMQEKIPLLAKDSLLNSVTIYTMPTKEAVQRTGQILNIAFQNTLTSEQGNLLEIKNDSDYSVVYGVKSTPEESYYSEVVIYNTDGKTGQMIVFTGTITPILFDKIVQTLAYRF